MADLRKQADLSESKRIVGHSALAEYMNWDSSSISSSRLYKANRRRKAGASRPGDMPPADGYGRVANHKVPWWFEKTIADWVTAWPPPQVRDLPGGLRVCSQCGETKPLTDFDGTSQGGHVSYCMACRRAMRKVAYKPHPLPRAAVEPGQRFGRLTVLREVQARKNHRRVLCACGCGTIKELMLHTLLRGEANSCGCIHREQLAQRNRECERAHPLYGTHAGMMTRCYDERHKAYPNYGGRGIAVYEPWHDRREFFRWMDENLGPRPDGKSMDRIDNDGDYEPGNVRWATSSEQARNRRCGNCEQLKAEAERLREQLAAFGWAA